MNEGKLWFSFAQDDLAMAALGFEHGLYGQACFHAQQCIEKALKGYLLGRGRRLPRTHSLVDLSRLAIRLGLPKELADEVAVLDSYYLPTRYPDALPTPDALPGKEEAKEAIESARRLLEWMEQGSIVALRPPA